jgi:diacylglycerol kinase family enzyme
MRLVFDDGEILDGSFTLTAIGNGKYCGGGYCAAPLASMDDGLMDICAIKKLSRFTLFTLIKSYKKGKYLESKRAMKYFEHKRVSHFKMEFKEPVPICIDGEIKGAKNIDFTVIPNAFNFVVPNGSEFKTKNI